MKRKVHIFLLLIAFASGSLSGQKQAIFPELNSSYGFIWPHHESIKYLVRGHSWSSGFRLLFPSDGSKNWQGLYRFPDLALAYRYTNLGNPDLLGSAHALYGNIDVPFSLNSKSHFGYQFSAGLGYLSKPFDIEDNYYNLAIGSRINVYFAFGLFYCRQISPNFRLKTSLSLSHFSNGAAKTPNLGFNIPAISMGFNYFPEKNRKRAIRSFSKKEKGINWYGILSGFWKEIYPAGNQSYPVSSLSLNSEYRWNKKKQAGLGLDLFYDASIFKQMENTDIEPNIRDNFRVGFHVGYTLIYGKTHFSIQTGTYLLSGFNTDGNIYNRFVIKYYTSKNIILSGGVKTHMGNADFVEVGIGYTLFRLNKYD